MKITIPQPCHENWDAMTPDEKGRFCSVCSKTVRDFTLASDKEIIDVLGSSSDQICGNFYESQLNRNLNYSYVNAVFVKFAVGFMLTAGGLVSVHAQQNITSDTLKKGEIQEVVISGFDHLKNSKKVLGSTTVIPADLLVNTIENRTKEIAPELAGVAVMQMPKENLGISRIRIGGARTISSDNYKPLVVIDGKVISLKDFQDVDTNSIETINILKDSSATELYGLKGQNGVIIIKTKKAKKPKK